jgi:3-dehydroquinate synthetase
MSEISNSTPTSDSEGRASLFLQWVGNARKLSARLEGRLPKDCRLQFLIQPGFLMPKEFVREFRVMTRSKLLKLVSEDKKLTDTRNLNFVFLERIGAVFRKKVTESF